MLPLLVALVLSAPSAPAGALEPSAFFDGASSHGPAADRDVAVEAGGIVRRAAAAAERSTTRVLQAEPDEPPAPLAGEEPLDGPPERPKKKNEGFMGGVKSFLNWDSRSLPAFAIGMGIGFGIVFFSGMLAATPLLGIAGGLFAGLVIGFLLNALKGK